MNAKRKRQWSQFSLRSFFIAITLLCIAWGYVAYERAKAASERQAAEAIKALGGRIGFGRTTRSAPMRAILGDDSYSNVDLVNLENFKGDVRLTDDDLRHLRHFPHLKKLYIHNVPITDSGLAHLRGLTELESLVLSRIPLTDAGLSHLQGMTHLEVLNLDHTPLKGPGLVHLYRMRSLMSLTLRETPVAVHEIEALQRNLPTLKVIR